MDEKMDLGEGMGGKIGGCLDGEMGGRLDLWRDG